MGIWGGGGQFNKKDNISRSLFKDTEGMQMAFCQGKRMETVYFISFDNQYGMLSARKES